MRAARRDKLWKRSRRQDSNCVGRWRGQAREGEQARRDEDEEDESERLKMMIDVSRD
jgi:hypothetical protein